MKLGILVNTDRNLSVVTGITHAALSKGHEVMIFAMDEGTRLLEQPEYTGLCSLPNVTMSFCDFSTRGTGVNKEGLSEAIICGSQYNNATMTHEADRVIIL